MSNTTPTSESVEQILLDLMFNASDIQERYYKRQIDSIITVADMREKVVKEAIAAIEALYAQQIQEARLDGRRIAAEATLDKWDNVFDDDAFPFRRFLQGQVDSHRYELVQLSQDTAKKKED